MGLPLHGWTKFGQFPGLEKWGRAIHRDRKCDLLSLDSESCLACHSALYPSLASGCVNLGSGGHPQYAHECDYYEWRVIFEYFSDISSCFPCPCPCISFPCLMEILQS